MGCTPSSSSQPGQLAVRSTHEDTKTIETFTILLLGAGDSGKSTLRKQLANIYESEFKSAEYRKTFAPTIVGNILDGTLQVLRRTDGMKDTFTDLQREARAGSQYISPSVAKTILQLYFENADFMETMTTKESEVQLADNYHEFMKLLQNYPTWGGPQWVPSEADCIRSRARTSGITSMEFVLDQRKFRIIDVGGQRAERKKWLHNAANIDKVSLVVFVAALSEYDQYLFEDRPKNRLEESLDLFGQCMNSDWLRDKPVLLFLNKKDIFDRKYNEQRIPLNVSGRFPDAPQTFVPPPEAITWIVSRYAKKRRSSNQRLVAYVLTATSASRVKTVFDQCSDLLIKREFIVGKPLNESQRSVNISSNVSTQSLG